LKRLAIIMAAFAYNSAMTDQKLPRRDANVASPFPGFDFRAAVDESAFRLSGLNHSICGQTIEHDEISIGFPGFLTVGTNTYVRAE
jgi:hypothetical protein